MRARKAYNPKRRLSEANLALAPPLDTLRYSGNPEHKRNPGDFGLDPPSSPRLGKTLCDGVGIFRRADALSLLKSGFALGLVSVQTRHGWPQNVWAVTADGKPVEAQLDSEGSYHGYPMPQGDPFREEILARWRHA